MITDRTIAEERVAVIAEAETWLGTKFHHGASIKGVGVDCARFLIACYAAAGVVESPDVGEYTPDWFLHLEGTALDVYVRWVREFCHEVDDPRPADIALFRFGRAVSHGAIVLDPNTVIHSFRGIGVTLGSLEPTHDLAPRLSGFWRLNRWRDG